MRHWLFLTLLAAACGADPSVDRDTIVCGTSTCAADAAQPIVDASSPDTIKWCGGVGGLTCWAGETCIDYPGDSCDPAKGDANCEGRCVRPDTPTCSGFAALSCPGTLSCYDDPRDSCDPAKGGGDCPGICL